MGGLDDQGRFALRHLLGAVGLPAEKGTEHALGYPLMEAPLWMGWSILLFSALGGIGSVVRIAQNERFYRWHNKQAKKKRKK